MSVDASTESVSSGQHAAAEPAAPPSDPLIVGLPTFIVGSVALGLALIGFVPASAANGAPIAIIIAATGVGMIFTAAWSANIGQTMVAGVFGIFSGFWLSYALLILAATNNWFGIPTAAVGPTVALFLVSWIVAVGMLLLATFRLPLAFTVLFALVEVALVLVLIGKLQNSAGVLAIAGIVVFLFALVGVYLFFGAASQATGGKNVPLGSPLIH